MHSLSGAMTRLFFGELQHPISRCRHEIVVVQHVDAVATRAKYWPLSRLAHICLTRSGCIVLSVVAKFLRCSLLEIPDQIVAKLQVSGVTCSGVVTDVSEPICFVQCVGPTSALNRNLKLKEIDLTSARKVGP